MHVFTNLSDIQQRIGIAWSSCRESSIRRCRSVPSAIKLGWQPTMQCNAQRGSRHTVDIVYNSLSILSISYLQCEWRQILDSFRLMDIYLRPNCSTTKGTLRFVRPPDGWKSHHAWNSAQVTGDVQVSWCPRDPTWPRGISSNQAALDLKHRTHYCKFGTHHQ